MKTRTLPKSILRSCKLVLSASIYFAFFVNPGILTGNNKQEWPGPVSQPNGGTPPTVETNGGPMAWTEIFPDGGNTSQNWNAVSISKDGSIMLAGIDWSGRLYRYSSGSWSETQPKGNSNGNYEGCDLSANGSMMLTGNPYVYRYGSGAWTTNYPVATTEPWTSFAVSSNGTKLFAGTSSDDYGNGYAYLNSSGVWTRQWPAGTNVQKSWAAAAMSADGSKILVVGAGTGTSFMYNRLYLYNGSSWTQVAPTGRNEDIYWMDVAMSDDGSVMYAGSSSTMYKYRGGSWSELNPTPGYPCQVKSIATNADGSKVLALGRDNAYLYQNGAWAEVHPAGPAPRTVEEWFMQTAMSGDGSKILVSSSGSSTGKKGLFLGSHSITDSITQTSVKIFGRITNIGSASPTIRGFCYGVNANPDITGTHTITNGTFGTGIFSEKITGLTPGTTYHARAYATNLYGTSYGADITFTTNPVFPAQLTIAVGSLIRYDSVAINSNITDIGGDSCTKRGILYYSYNGTDKTLKSSGISTISETGRFGTGTWTDTIGGLSVNIKFSVRSFGVNLADTAYSSRQDFYTAAKTPAAPTVSTPTTTSLKVTINVNGNPASTYFAIQDSASAKYVHSSGILVDTAVWQTASFWGQKVVTGLTTGITYYFRVKARNGDRVETAFGPTASGMPVGPPTVTVSVDSATNGSAFLTGNISSLNGGTANSRGFIHYPYSNTDKVIGNAGVVNVSESGNWSTGQFNDTLTGLTCNTRYNARAVAINNYGTGYSDRTDFWTLANTPSAPVVINPQLTSLDVLVNTNGNPAITTYAIRSVKETTSKFIHSTGILVDTAVWQTAAAWDTTTVTGLTTGASYIFSVKARSGSSDTTAFGPTATGIPYGIPDVTTGIADNTTTTAVRAQGRITSVNGNLAVNRGVICYPYSDTAKVIGGYLVVNVAETATYDTCRFAEEFTGLSVNTRYCYRAHATNAKGTGYGSKGDFWTLANIPDRVSVNGATNTTLNVGIDGASNPAITQYGVYESHTGKWVQANGTLGTTAVWQTETQWEVNDGNQAKTVIGLLENNIYSFKAKARNGNDIETDFGIADSLYTLAAVPGVPVTSGPTNASVDVKIFDTVNPVMTKYSVYETGTSMFVQTNGTLGFDTVFNTKALWHTNAGNTAKTVTGLLPDSAYFFGVTARNGDLVNTASGDTSKVRTHANVPAPPMVINPAATSLDVSVVVNGNPAHTRYAIQDSVNAVFVQSNGSCSAVPVWQTAADWDTVTVTGLATGTVYYFRVMAKNLDGDRTAFGLTTARNTCANPTDGGKISASQEICTGTVPQWLVNVTEAGNYGGTLEYQWQFSTLSDSTGFSNITGADSTAFAPDTLTTTTWYRRLARVSCKPDWSDATASNVLEITVYPLTVGGSVSGDTIVCYGSHETLLTLSGHTGEVQKWQRSADGAVWTDIDSTGSTMIVRDLVADTWFRAVVQSGVCAPEISDSILIRVFKNYKITGYVRYENNPKTALTGLEVFLRKGSVIIDSTLTNWQGKYEFDSLTNGTFGLIVRSAHPTGNWQTWGGVNMTDYLLAYRHAMNTLLLPSTPPVNRIAGDVKQPQSPPVVNLADANAIQLAAKYGWGNPAYFQIPKWVFSGLTDAQRIDTFELACVSLTRNIQGLCAGDVNGSFTPGTGFKMAEPGLALENRGSLPVREEMSFPVAVSQTATIGALTLILNYDPAQIEITGVDMPGNDGTLPWFMAENGILSIGWASVEPEVAREGQPVLMIRARLAGATDLIRFTLNDNPLSELADGEGNVLQHLKLFIPDAGSNPDAYCLMPIALYPNPARDVINVEFAMETDGVACVNLMTLQGVKLLTTGNIHAEAGMHKMTLNLSDLPNGIYLTRVTRNGQVQIKKVVVNK